MSAIVRVEREFGFRREKEGTRALSTRIFALISLVRLACKREKQTEKERENDRVKRGLYICVCVKKRKNEAQNTH